MNNNIISNQKIMMIDDDISIMNLLSVFLSKYGHSLTAFTEPIAAIEELKNNEYNILIVNYTMSPVNGDKIVELVRGFNKEIYIIMLSSNKDLIPSMNTLNELDIQAFFEKNLNFDQLILGIQSAAKYNSQLTKIKDMNQKIEISIMEFSKILMKTVDAKDQYTGEHCKRVAYYSLKLGAKLKLSATELSNLNLAAMFHDIGKIGIPDNILQKKSRLTDEEYETIKYHPIIGANILSVSTMFEDVAKTVLEHHERVDGKGYPYGLKSNEISKLGKILCICDTFDAITSKRSYKENFSIDFALEEFEKIKGTQLDLEYTNAFIDLINEDKEKFLID